MKRTAGLRTRSFALLASIACLYLVSCDPDPGPDPRVETGPPPIAPPGAEANILPIPGSFQQTAVWCWAAVAEMVFRYYGVPNVNPFGNYQCGIVAMSFGGPCLQDCGYPSCIAPAGNAANYLDILTNYAERLQSYAIQSPDIDAVWVPSPLTFAEIRTEIDGGRPIVAGISPGAQYVLPGNAMHAILLIGYYESPQGQLVVLNDPFPYGFATFTGDPYVAVGTIHEPVGRYIVNYSSLVGPLAWSDSFVAISAH